MKVYEAKTERMLIASVMERPEHRDFVLSRLNAELFGSDVIREIFDRMLFLAQKGEDVVGCGIMAQDPGLSDAARTTLQLTARDRTKLRQYTKKDLMRLVDITKYYYKKRVLYEEAKWIADELASQKMADIAEIQAHMQRAITQVDQYDDVAKGLDILGKRGNVGDAYLRSALTQKEGLILPTGFTVFDERGHISKGNMVLLTAKRGQGKSMLAKSIGMSHFWKGCNVYTVNLEMERWEYLARVFAEVTDFGHERIRRGFIRTITEEYTTKEGEVKTRERTQVNEKGIKKILAKRRKIDAYGEKNDCRWALRTVTNPYYTPQLLHQELRNQGYDVVIIDYINLFHQGKQELWQAIYENTKYLKMMAKELGVVVYVLGQLTDEGRAKYARAAEEDSDVWWHWEVNRGNPLVKFFHGKARHYKPFSFELVFDGANSRFIERSEIDDEEFRDIQRRAEDDAQEWIKHQEEVERDREVGDYKPTRRGGRRTKKQKPREDS
jgi:replicative DNA helicase